MAIVLLLLKTFSSRVMVVEFGFFFIFRGNVIYGWVYQGLVTVLHSIDEVKNDIMRPLSSYACSLQLGLRISASVTSYVMTLCLRGRTVLHALHLKLE